jgi:uncharacterized membrane protein
MKSRFNIKKIVNLSAVAALYAIFTLITTPISYFGIQFRFSEILVLLVFFRKDYALSIIIGCFIANLVGPLGILDITLGVLQTIIAVLLISKSKNLFLSALYPVITMPIIALELHLAINLGLMEPVPFWILLVTTMAGEAVVMILFAYPIMRLLRKNKTFLELIDANRNVEEI